MGVLRRSGEYDGSQEELTPIRRDPIAATPVGLATVATLLRPAWWRWFVSSSVANYALSPVGWHQVFDRVALSMPAVHSSSGARGQCARMEAAVAGPPPNRPRSEMATT